MNEDELNELIDGIESEFLVDVREALDAVADEFADALDDATELVAARFRVSSIRDMWQGRVGRLMDRLRVITGRAASTVAEDLGDTLPDDWDTALDDYTTATERLLTAVGDDMAAEAMAVLAEGLNQGDDVEQLKVRLREAFSTSSTNLGPDRAERIAQTEATRAWNAGTLAAAQSLTGPDRPLIKQWVTRQDRRVREAHRDTNGQLRLLDDAFDVAGTLMQYPGDPAAPPSLTVGCRCVLRTAVAERTASMADGEELQSRMPPQLRRYWLSGPGAARIGWGTPGSFDRCVRELRDDFPQNPEGLCANLYHEATGRWPGQDRDESGAETHVSDESGPPDDLIDAVYGDESYDQSPPTVSWSTPGTTGLAFEDQQTGDGRVFTPGALYWGAGPWPLLYAEEMGQGHEGARLAGSIVAMGRDGNRITGSGVLYLTQSAGYEAAVLLSQDAPLGVSVDLDDVDLEVVDMSATDVYRIRAVHASVMPTPDGGWVLNGETDTSWTASGVSLVGESTRFQWHIDAEGGIPAGAFEISAAANDTGRGGEVVDAQTSGQFLTRITQARVRGATLVPIPAYADARIVVDDGVLRASSEAITAGYTRTPSFDYDRIVRSVSRSLVPMTSAELSKNLRIPMDAVRRHLASAAQKGDLVRLTRGHYVGPNSEPDEDPDETPDTVASRTASATGSVDLPVAARDVAWDGPAAEARVFSWADGDCSRLDMAFAWRDDSVDCSQHNSRKLGFADVRDGELVIIPRGVFAAQAALDGARGGVDIPADDVPAVRERLQSLRTHVDEETEDVDDLEASAWIAMRDLPPMPSAWFREPTEEELPPGGPGVNYRNGRIFGWVAQAGEPHAGHAKKITIDGLGRIDTSHFLRQRFTLDDGSEVRAGVFTMNVGHHRDGAECETSACQFDDSRTVAGIVTVGMSKRGMWFSGAAAPWMSSWDRAVFMTTQPSYHMKKGPDGNWQLRAVLSVPVPGHSSPLLASAVVDRSNLALTAAATMVDVDEAVAAATEAHEGVNDTHMCVNDDPAVATSQVRDGGGLPGVSTVTLTEMVAAAVEAAMDAREARKAAEEAELAALVCEALGLEVDNEKGN